MAKFINKRKDTHKENYDKLVEDLESEAIKEYSEEEESDDTEDYEERTKMKKMHFAYWTVRGRTYRLKLKTKSIELLENKYKTNLINLMGSESSLPPLKIMLEIAHEAMKEWHHGIKYENVLDLFDAYIDDGGSQLKFFTNVFTGIYIASGFFTPEMATEMLEAMAEAEKMM